MPPRGKTCVERVTRMALSRPDRLVALIVRAEVRLRQGTGPGWKPPGRCVAARILAPDLRRRAGGGAKRDRSVFRTAGATTRQRSLGTDGLTRVPGTTGLTIRTATGFEVMGTRGQALIGSTGPPRRKAGGLVIFDPHPDEALGASAATLVPECWILAKGARRGWRGSAVLTDPVGIVESAGAHNIRIDVRAAGCPGSSRACLSLFRAGGSVATHVIGADLRAAVARRRGGARLAVRHAGAAPDAAIRHGVARAAAAHDLLLAAPLVAFLDAFAGVRLFLAALPLTDLPLRIAARANGEAVLRADAAAPATPLLRFCRGGLVNPHGAQHRGAERPADQRAPRERSRQPLYQSVERA